MEEESFSLKKKLPQKVQKALGIEDQRFQEWDQCENPVTTSLESLTREGDEK